MSTEAAALSPVYNPQVQAFVSDGEEINGVTYLDLVEKHGADNVNNALFNLFNEVYIDDVMSEYKGSPIEDDAFEFLNEQKANAEQSTTPGAQEDVDKMYRDVMKMYAENREDELNGEMEAAPGESAKSKKGGGETGDGSDNWLIVLAKAMGHAAGEHLKQAVLSGYKIADISGRADQDTGTQGGRDANAQKAQDMAMEQAKMQAHSQMFKMSFEATSTLIKTTGEGMATMGRKQ